MVESFPRAETTVIPKVVSSHANPVWRTNFAALQAAAADLNFSGHAVTPWEGWTTR